MRLLDEGERHARESGDQISLARLLTERASFTGEVEGADEVVSLVESPDAIRFADAALRMGMLYLWNGKVTRALELYQTLFERLIPAGAIVNEPEGMVWYSLATFHAGDLDGADALADRLLEDATRRSVHTRQHALALKGFLQLARGAWDGVAETTQEITQLVDANPDAGFCLLGASGCGYGAVANILAGQQAERLDEVVERMVPESTLIQVSAVMVPKVMEGHRAASDDGLKAYAPGLRLADRARAWDFSDLMPAIALTMLERWDELGPSLARLDLFTDGGSRVAAAVAAAIREEEAAAKGSPAPTHAELRGLGCLGISELLRFRPT